MKHLVLVWLLLSVCAPAAAQTLTVEVEVAPGARVAARPPSTSRTSVPEPVDVRRSSLVRSAAPPNVPASTGLILVAPPDPALLGGDPVVGPHVELDARARVGEGISSGEIVVQVPRANGVTTVPSSGAQAVLVVTDDAIGGERVVLPQTDERIAASRSVVTVRAPDEDDADEETEEPEHDIDGYVGFSAWVENMNLSQLGFTMHRPEVEALTGVHLGRQWAGNAPMASRTFGGVSLAVGLRCRGFLRGPELRLRVGGGDIDGPWAAAAGSSGIELSLRSALIFQAEASVGVQLPLGPVTPYVVGIASAGGVWVDVGERVDGLGRLGSDTVDAAILQLGTEAGLSIDVAPGVELSAAFRAGLLGVRSYGGMITLGFDGLTEERVILPNARFRLEHRHAGRVWSTASIRAPAAEPTGGQSAVTMSPTG